MKLQEIKEKTIDELKELVLEGKKELFTLKMSHNKFSFNWKFVSSKS